MSFDTAGRKMMGVTSQNKLSLVQTQDHPAAVFGANCVRGASYFIRNLQGFDAKKPTSSLIAKGNACIPKYADGHIHYDRTPGFKVSSAVIALNSGAKIIEGFCGAMPEYLERMRYGLEICPPNKTPSLQKSKEMLGAFASADDGTCAWSHLQKRL